MAYPDPRTRTGFQPISDYVGPEWNPWAYCQGGCGHNVQLDIASIVAKTGLPQNRRPIRNS